MQSDPIGLLSGPSTYGYAFADPLRLFDPLGLYGSVYRDGNTFSYIPSKYGSCLEANWIGGYIFGWIPCRPKPQRGSSGGEYMASSSGNSSSNSGLGGDGNGPSGADDPSGNGPYRRGSGNGPLGSGGPNSSGGPNDSDSENERYRRNVESAQCSFIAAADAVGFHGGHHLTENSGRFPHGLLRAAGIGLVVHGVYEQIHCYQIRNGH